ncbi:alpha/beta hydrolase [Dictyobacter kobayashii]|uniref:Serine aminopeptidase S33 domain-containing protein n=1 Tax=Dictyobacter kobayashii TaxID=2014872 RepID=A0A402ABV6_9CHLR|nr:alpha/beta fold hydrolase [Dictyobacter kobayashii]GCE16575.1 hypothetical protein KDK_03750 [Dictyobacter kobayashii]
MLKSSRLLLFSLLLILLAACTSQETATPAATPTLAPSPTPGVTPTTTIPAITSTLVHFKTSDDVNLAGSMYGSGKIFVICSHELRTTKEIWKDSGMPQRLAALGYHVLAYDFRGNGDSAGTSNLTILDTDLKAAITFAKKQGATKIVLLGSSMGGTASLKVAASTDVAAVVTLSAPEMFPTNVTDEDVKAIKAPKLFINSEFDDYTNDTKHMYDVASAPKELHIYTDSNLHGVALFGSDHSADLYQRILTFITHYAPLS